MLIGQYTKKAAEMQNEVIDLPDNVEVSLIYYYYLYLHLHDNFSYPV